MCGIYLGISWCDIQPHRRPPKKAMVELSKLSKLSRVPGAEINITPSNMGKIIATSSSGKKNVSGKEKNWDSYGSCF